MATCHPAYDELARTLGPDRLRRNEPLAAHTTFRIGGPADLFYEATTTEELLAAVLTARRLEVPWFVLGLGANVLVGDRGFRGIVIRNKTAAVRVLEESHRVWAESGVVVSPDLIETCVRCGLSGLEHYAGIPSTVGGALWQNLHFLSPAPERGRTVYIAEVLESAELLTEQGTVRTVGVDYFQFGYDDSILHRTCDVVLTATFKLERASEEAMRHVVETNLAWRRLHHPPLDSQPSAGSVFKKVEGVGAGRLIESCGLKGMQVGGAQVSPRHANIIVNRGNATARDVRRLIAHIQEVVQRETGYRLEPEISFVGEF